MTINYTTKLGWAEPTDGDVSWGTAFRANWTQMDNLMPDYLFMVDTANTSGLTFAMKGGSIRSDNTVATWTAATVTLTDASTNYVEAYLDSNNAVQVAVNQTGFTSGRVPLYEVVTASGAISTTTDCRTWLSIASGGSGSGKSTLVAEVDVTSAVSSVQFTGLSAVADGGYLLSALMVSADGTNNQSIRCHINGDANETDYKNQVLDAHATTIAANSAGNISEVSYLFASEETQTDITIDIIGGIVMARGISTFLQSGAIWNGWRSVVMTPIQTDVTSLTLVTASGAGFAPGSKFRLYRRKT